MALLPSGSTLIGHQFATAPSGVTYRYISEDQWEIVTTKSDLDLKEDSDNKQNSLAIDGTGEKFPTVDAVIEGISVATTLQNVTTNGRETDKIMFTKINGASFSEFENTAAPGNTKVAVGMQGNPEANLSFNMDYTTNVHKYYDPTYNALWLALGPLYWALQYAPSGASTEGDMWNDTGNRYLIRGNNEKGSMAVNVDLPEDVGDGQFVVKRRTNLVASITGYSDLVLEGHRTAGVLGPVYINTYNSGAVSIANGGGKVGVRVLVPINDFEVKVATGTGISSSEGMAIHDGQTQRQSLLLGVNTAGLYSWIQSAQGGVLGGKNLSIQPEGGDVGIGKTNPTVKLDVLGAGIFSGNLTSQSTLIVNRVGALAKGILAQTSGSNRWFYGADASSESGSNAGTNFIIERSSDAGTSLGKVLTIDRATGVSTFRGVTRVERLSTSAQYTQIDHEAGATTILGKNGSGAGYSQVFISQGNNTTDRNVINIDINGKVVMAFAASVATAPSASTDVVRKLELDLKASLASPAFTGTPTAPTATAGTNTTQLATTAFVQSATLWNVISSTLKPISSATPVNITNSGAVALWAESTSGGEGLMAKSGNATSARFNNTGGIGGTIEIATTGSNPLAKFSAGALRVEILNDGTINQYSGSGVQNSLFSGIIQAQSSLYFAYIDGNQGSISFGPTGANAIIKADNLTTQRTFQMPNTSGTIGLAPLESAATTTQTSATLNSSYPSVIAGQVVIAPSVGTGMGYIKKANGNWMSFVGANI